MLEKFKLSIIIIIFCISYTIADNTTIGSESLRVTINQNAEGISIDEISNREYNFLSGIQIDLLELRVHNIQTDEEIIIGANNGWKNISVNTDDNSSLITLSSPKDIALPSTLNIKIAISVKEETSTWDLNVSGLGDHHSLINAEYPIFNIKSENNDNFFVPYYHGKVFKNTKENAFEYTTRYPRGWSGTMQYMAYYNDNYGLYFGMHDPKASIKNFSAKTEDGGIKISQNTFVANKTLANNSWELPGYFEFDLFKGDWYEAALKYRFWVFEQAEYKPVDTPERVARQERLGNVAIWVQESVEAYTMTELENHIRTFKAFMDIPVGVAWTSFNGLEFDTLYPEIFPEKDGLKEVITRLKADYNDNIYISAYMNGMLYDTNLASYPSYEAHAIINSTGNVSTATFNDILFANMCPSQGPWQDIMTDSAKKITQTIDSLNPENLGFDNVYVDMVTAASAKECFDPTHGHTLGGGSYWRDGYKQMFYNMHEASKDGASYISEEANDFLIDEVDGFLTIGYSTNNQVPALSAVYAGKVQLVGLPMGWSDYKGSDDPDSQRFYGRMAQSFNYGVQLGRFWMGLVSNTHERTRRAATFVRKLGRLRVKLKEFISFGRMLKPLELNGDIPNVTFSPYGFPGTYQEDVVIPAVQTSVWNDGNDIALIFVNGKVPTSEDDNVSFYFDFNASQYGIEGDVIKIREITENNETTDEDIAANFTKNITLKSYDAKVFILSFYQDSDGDGYSDNIDAFPNNPNEWLDTDADGIGNNADSDDDNDGMSDEFENQYSFNPLDASDANEDADSDGYANLEEYLLGTNPRDANDIPPNCGKQGNYICDPFRGSIYPADPIPGYIVCPENKHLKQGTGQCTLDGIKDLTTFRYLPRSTCAEGKVFKQGVGCVSEI